MGTAELAVVYVLIGSGAAIVMMVRGDRPNRILDAAILVPFWPLYAPFLLLVPQPSGVVRILPDEHVLAARLSTVRDRIGEIDRLLERPEFSESVTVSRRKLLTESGDTRAAQAAEARLTNIRRVRALRDRYTRELTEVDELLAQLSVQSEVVRLAGNPASLDDLVQEIIHRVEGLDTILAADFDKPHAQIPPPLSSPTMSDTRGSEDTSG